MDPAVVWGAGVTESVPRKSVQYNIITEVSMAKGLLRYIMCCVIFYTILNSYIEVRCLVQYPQLSL
jgi:hypothetical protein